LGDVFGVRVEGQLQGPMSNSYLRLEYDATRGHHQLLNGLTDTPRIINGVWRVGVAPTRALTARPLTLIPPYPDLPMEMVYPRVERTDEAQVFLGEVGRGRVVYFPWDIDRVFWEVLSVDHGRLLANAVEWATNEERPVTVTGPGLLDVTIWRQKQSLTVHLVNLTNPMMMKGPLRELLPLPEQRVRIKQPEGTKPVKVHLLVGETAPRVEHAPGYVDVTVPLILDHEVVAVDF